MRLTTSIYTPSIGSNRGYKNDASPSLAYHVLYHSFDENKRRAEINVQHIIEIVKGDIQYIGYSFPVSGVRDHDVGWVAVLGLDLLEHGLDLVGGSNVNLVN